MLCARPVVHVWQLHSGRCSKPKQPGCVPEYGGDHGIPTAWTWARRMQQVSSSLMALQVARAGSDGPMAGYMPQPQVRERPLWQASSTALLFVECQNFIGHRAGAIYRNYSSAELQVCSIALALDACADGPWCKLCCTWHWNGLSVWAMRAGI